MSVTYAAFGKGEVQGRPVYVAFFPQDTELDRIIRASTGLTEFVRAVQRAVVEFQVPPLESNVQHLYDRAAQRMPLWVRIPRGVRGAHPPPGRARVMDPGDEVCLFGVHSREYIATVRIEQYMVEEGAASGYVVVTVLETSPLFLQSL